MKFCDGKCGRLVTDTNVGFESTYLLKLKKPYSVSKVYAFCSAGCLEDWVDLEKQGHVTLEYEPEET